MGKRGEGQRQTHSRTTLESKLTATTLNRLVGSSHPDIQAAKWALRQSNLQHLTGTKQLSLLAMTATHTAKHEAALNPNGRPAEKILLEDFGITQQIVQQLGEFMAQGWIDGQTWKTFAALASERKAQLTNNPNTRQANSKQQAVGTPTDIIRFDRHLLAMEVAAKEEALKIDQRTRRSERERG